MNWFRFLCGLFFIVTIPLYIGCKQSSQTEATVQGNVTIDGVLASRGTVTFHPEKNGPVAVGQIHEDGSYSLRTGLGNSANPDAAKISVGKYFVTVMVMGEPSKEELNKEDGSPPAAGPRLTAIKYAGKDTSGLAFEIKPGSNLIPLELEGSANDPPPEIIVSETSTERTEAEHETIENESQNQSNSDQKSKDSKTDVQVYP